MKLIRYYVQNWTVVMVSKLNVSDVKWKKITEFPENVQQITGKKTKTFLANFKNTTYTAYLAQQLNFIGSQCKGMRSKQDRALCGFSRAVANAKTAF